MAYVRTRGVVLRCTDYSESSQVAALSTPDFGQVHVLAKGSRRPRRDGRTALDALSYCDLVLARRSPGKLHLLTDWSLRETFPGLREDLSRLWTAFYAAEVMLACTSETPEDGAACDQFLGFLRRLDRQEREDLALFLFLTRLLRTVGHAPVADHCAQCRKGLFGRTRFSPAAGGALCADCAPADPSAFAMSRGALAVMNRLAVSDDPGPALRITPDQAQEIRRAFNEQIQYHLGKALRTARFLVSVP